eukprot:Clim_evm183s157 gene=Clim_evmTU183s157
MDEKLLEELKWMFLGNCTLPEEIWKLVEMHICQNETSQLVVLEQTSLSRENQAFPVDRKYEKLFLRRIINCLERVRIDLSDELADRYGEIVSAPDNKGHLTYHILGKTVSIEHDRDPIGKGETGMHLWAAGIRLADWLVENAGELRSQSVLELGAGVGLTSVVLAACIANKGACTTDCSADVLNVLQANMEQNGVSPVRFPHAPNYDPAGGTKVVVSPLDWCSDDPPAGWDYLVGADIIYDPKVVPQLAAFCGKFVRQRPGAKAVIFATLRQLETYQLFIDSLHALDPPVTVSVADQGEGEKCKHFSHNHLGAGKRVVIEYE